MQLVTLRNIHFLLDNNDEYKNNNNIKKKFA